MIINANSLHAPLADTSVHCIVTSPPYHGLRDYGLTPTPWPTVSYSPMAGLPEITIPAQEACLGLESTLEAYVGHMVLIARELWRVLRDDGVLWLNVGDSYAANRGYQVPDTKHTDVGNGRGMKAVDYGLKPKDLMLVPHRLALALQADGWYMRSMPWIKTNGLPESVSDRPTKSEEYILMLAKSQRYYYDLEAVRRPSTGQTGKAASFARSNDVAEHIIPNQAAAIHRAERTDTTEGHQGRNLRTSDFAWTSIEAYQRHLDHIQKHKGLLLAEDGSPAALFSNVGNFPGSHFATFPKALVEPLILASTSAKGVCWPVWRSLGQDRRKIDLPGRKNSPYRQGRGPTGRGCHAAYLGAHQGA